jgi:hypothetical protein
VELAHTVQDAKNWINLPSWGSRTLYRHNAQYDYSCHDILCRPRHPLQALDW